MVKIKNVQPVAREIKTLYLEINPEFICPSGVRAPNRYIEVYRVGIKEDNPSKSIFHTAADFKGITAKLNELVGVCRKKRWRAQLREVDTIGHRILFKNLDGQIGLSAKMTLVQFGGFIDYVATHPQNCAAPQQ
jgi:hypothetical protein